MNKFFKDNTSKDSKDSKDSGRGKTRKQPEWREPWSESELSIFFSPFYLLMFWMFLDGSKNSSQSQGACDDSWLRAVMTSIESIARFFISKWLLNLRVPPNVSYRN